MNSIFMNVTKATAWKYIFAHTYACNSIYGKKTFDNINESDTAMFTRCIFCLLSRY